MPKSSDVNNKERGVPVSPRELGVFRKSPSVSQALCVGELALIELSRGELGESWVHPVLTLEECGRQVSEVN